MKLISRREFLQMLIGIPVIGAVVVVLSPLLRYLRPTVKPFQYFPQPELAASKPLPVAKLSELSEPWSSKEFLFNLQTVEYTPRGKQVSKIPGIVVRLPDDVAEKSNNGQKYVCFQRICTHLGCVFRFETNPDEVAKGFNYRPDDAVFACPCHLSVFALTKRDEAWGTVGKVVSGPAQRPPRKLEFEIKNDEIVVTGAEAGGIA